MAKIKEIDWLEVNEKGLTGLSGKVYHLEPLLNVDRYKEAEKLLKQLEFGMTNEAIFTKLNQVSDLFNKAQLQNGMVELAKLQERFYTIGTRGEVAMKLAALYLNEKDEDTTVISQHTIDAKIADWRGYAYASFFALSVSIISGLKDSLELAARNGSIRIVQPEQDEPKSE